ncbi:MAG: hypothetical protein KDC36_08815 [Thermoleophilia bacterium]|nr:hypothetical protein [Thermoleophilia bacterium]
MDAGGTQQLRWRVLVLLGVALTVVFSAVGLFQFQSNEVVRCSIQSDAGVTQQFEFSLDDEVGEGCQYAVDAARATQRARWWWFGAGAVLALTFAAMPLSTLRRPADDQHPDDDAS